MPARLTYKLALTFAVGLLFVSALGTRAGGVGRIDRIERDASERALVAEKGSQLVEGPTGVPVAPRATDAHLLANASKVFDTDAFPFGFRFLDNALADAVVNGLLEPPFSSTEPSQDTFGALHAFGLERGASSVIPITDAVYLFTAERGAVVKSGKLDDTEIHADPRMVAIEVGRRLLHINVDVGRSTCLTSYFQGVVAGRSESLHCVINGRALPLREIQLAFDRDRHSSISRLTREVLLPRAAPPTANAEAFTK